MSASAIERIRAMQAKGTITAAQADELIAALQEEDVAPVQPASPDVPGAPEPPRASRRGADRFFDMDWVGDMVEGITSSLGVSTGSMDDDDPRRPGRGDRSDYRYEWSRGRRSRGGGWGPAQVEQPVGEDFEYKDNHVTFSRIIGVQLFRAKMKDNTFSAASLTGAQVVDGTMESCFLAGASLNDLRIEGGRMKSVFLKGCKVNRLVIGKGSTFKDTRIAGAGVTDLSLDGESSLENSTISGGVLNGFSLGMRSLLKSCRLSGVAVTQLSLDGSRVKDSWFKGSFLTGGRARDAEVLSCAFRGVRLQDFELTSSRIKDSRFDAIGFQDLKVIGSTLKNVIFRDTPLDLPRMGQGFSILDSRLDNMEFTGCTFRNTTIKGVTADNLRLRGVDLTDRTIESADELRSIAR
jgi:uncharacterized protein YjbI with pentapeptide repeats